VLLVVDDEREPLERIHGELSRRYGSDYRIVRAVSGRSAIETLEALRSAGEDVALVLADQWMGDMTGAELLAQVTALHPRAKRVLTMDWGGWADRRTADAIVQAMALGRMDYYALKPWRSPDELFLRTVAEFVHEWSRTDASQPSEITVVGEQWDPRAHALRSLLARAGIPHAFHSCESPEGRQVLGFCGQSETTDPVVRLWDGRVLLNPSTAELATAYGVRTELADSGGKLDVVVVGAGPAGLAAAVYAASEGLRTLVVEREAVGGQAGSSSLVRNYLGFPRGVSGAELAQRAYQQAWVFGAELLLMSEVMGIAPAGDGYEVTVSDGTQVTTPAVVLATGVAYRRIGIPALERLSGAGVFYGASVSEGRGLAGLPAFVVGGGNSAGQAALHLSRWASKVTLLVRGPDLAADMSQYLQDELAVTANVEVRLHSEVVDAGGDGRLERLMVRDNATGQTTTEQAAAVFILIGARPPTGWLPDIVERDDHGYVLTGAEVPESHGLGRPRLPYESSAAGIFAVGDVRRGAVKRVASAAGEGSVVISQLHEYFALRQARRDEERQAPAST
jgi:thioredoxin reductase (NADPH)